MPTWKMVFFNDRPYEDKYALSMAVSLETQLKVADGEVELLWATPQGEGAFPAILFVHGHMENRAGARIHKNFLISQKRLDRWGVCLASVSQPGYGGSSGLPDYCGPQSQEAVREAISFLKIQPMIDPKRIALVGYSRGAIVAAMTTTQVTNIRAAVLGAGFYDFKSYFEQAPEGIQAAIRRESGIDETAFDSRSAVKAANSIQTPLLILHGTRDERGGAPEAERFSKIVSSNGMRAELRIYQQYGHHIPFRIFLAETRKFLAEELNCEQ